MLISAIDACTTGVPTMWAFQCWKSETSGKSKACRRSVVSRRVVTSRIAAAQAAEDKAQRLVAAGAQS